MSGVRAPQCPLKPIQFLFLYILCQSCFCKYLIRNSSFHGSDANFQAVFVSFGRGRRDSFRYASNSSNEPPSQKISTCDPNILMLLPASSTELTLSESA